MYDDWILLEDELIARQKNWLLANRDAAVAEADWENLTGTSGLPLKADER
jgi:hypothetical protein